MKKRYVFTIFIIISCCSYTSLWYGFAKGYEYEVGNNLADSVITSKALSLIRDGKSNEAIELLEHKLDSQIIERAVVDREFIKYLIGFPRNHSGVDQRLEEQIKKYRKSTNYKCKSAVDVCKAINGFLYGIK